LLCPPILLPNLAHTRPDVEHGAFVSIGADDYEVGVETAKMAVKVIQGEIPKNIPISKFVPEKMGVNPSLAKLYGVSLPETSLKKAAVVKR
jgi:ABC-type uncharacterized transport system substrate-binding protein